MIDFIKNVEKITYIMNRLQLFYFILGFLFSINTYGQKPYLPNGGMFTPEGEIKALVVFVGFSHKIWDGNDSIPFNHQEYDNWDIKNGQNFPPYVDENTGEMTIFHNNLKGFDKIDQPNNISDYYDQMSMGKLKFMAECLTDPVTNKAIRIDIDPTPLASIKDFNKAAIDKIHELYPDFDWSEFDSRKNAPNYRKNTNQTRSDGKPECVIFIYRHHKGMTHQVYVKQKLGWNGGVASSYLVGYKSKWDNYSFDNTGFTLSDESGKSENNFVGMFLHEIGHKLYNAPHYNGANGTIGSYFYYPGFSYGMMNSTNFSNLSANGWERWVLGWINLDKNNKDASSSIQNMDDKTYSFVLNDFVTQGDAIRIPIPHYPNNYLWIENHQNISVMERGMYEGKVMSSDGEQVPKIDKGIYVYVERISANRNSIPRYGNRYQSNGLRMYHADGNWDYKLAGNVSRSWKTYYNQPIIPLKKMKRNAFSGTNPFRRFVFDFPKNWDSKNPGDDKIVYRSSIHGGHLESIPFSRQKKGEEIITVYGFSGGVTPKMKSVLNSRSPFFQDGDKLSLNSDNPIYGLQTYNKRKKNLDPIHINGMSIELKELENSAYLVTVSYDKFSIDYDKTWMGNLDIRPNYIDSSNYSLVLNENVSVIIDKSGTVNTHVKTSYNDFIVNSELTIKKGARVLLKEGAKLIVKNNSTLNIEAGAYLKLLKKSLIIIEKGSHLNIEVGAKVDKIKKGQIIIK